MSERRLAGADDGQEGPFHADRCSRATARGTRKAPTDPRHDQVIRGVLPYVSASTLRHADRGRPKTEPGTKRNLAFLFTDIRGFSTLCEEQHPDQVVKMLNRYLRIQAEIITTNGGDVDKFVGDEIVAMFDGPKKELHACRASVGQPRCKQRELAELASHNVVSIGIGITCRPSSSAASAPATGWISRASATR
jgi:class 3 adenylate cyclase